MTRLKIFRTFLPIAASSAFIASVSVAAGDTEGWKLEFAKSLGGAVPTAADICGLNAVVGNSSSLGAAMIVQRSASGPWMDGVSLQRPSNVSLFGFSVAIDGDVAIVGGPGSGGRAVIYERAATGEWSEGLVLANPGGGSQFGYAVDIEEGIALVGAPQGGAAGRAHVFEQAPNGEWLPVQVLAGSGGQAVNFGSSVAISAGLALVGAPSGTSGRAELFRRDSSGIWNTEQIFTYPGLPQLGTAVGIDADTVVVGAPAAAGRAVVWERLKGGDWDAGTLLPGGSNLFGTAVAIGNDRILIGAPSPGAGGAVGFKRAGDGSWILEANLPALGFGSQLGQSVAIDGDQAMVGANGAFGIYRQAGCPGEGCIADLNCDGIVDGGDLSILLGDWGLTDSPANISDKGPVNGADLALLLSDWGLCP